MPKEEKAKEVYQKNHISNEAVILVSKLSYKDLGPYISRCTDSFIQLKNFLPDYLSTLSAAYLVAASSTLALFVSKIAPFAVISSKMKCAFSR